MQKIVPLWKKKDAYDLGVFYSALCHPDCYDPHSLRTLYILYAICAEVLKFCIGVCVFVFLFLV